MVPLNFFVAGTPLIKPLSYSIFMNGKNKHDTTQNTTFKPVYNWRSAFVQLNTQHMNCLE